jgi:hypothetical protein
MLHLFDDLWLDKLIPKNNVYCVSRRVFLLCYFRRKYKSSSFLQLCLIMLNQNIHIYIYKEPRQIVTDYGYLDGK